MAVSVKNLDAAIELKNKGMELEIRDSSGNFKGDLVVTGTKIIWCNGKTKRENGISISLDEFTKLMNERNDAAKAKAKEKTARKAPAPKAVKVKDKA